MKSPGVADQCCRRKAAKVCRGKHQLTMDTYLQTDCEKERGSCRTPVHEVCGHACGGQKIVSGVSLWHLPSFVYKRAYPWPRT